MESDFLGLNLSSTTPLSCVALDLVSFLLYKTWERMPTSLVCYEIISKTLNN